MAAALLLGAGCDAGPGPEASPAARARFIYESNCATCHGPQGAGDGISGGGLNPPRSFRDREWQAEVDDARIARVMVEGGEAVGLSPLMPPNPDLADEPAVVEELVKIVRGFGE